MTLIAITGHRPDKFGLKYGEFDDEALVTFRDREAHVERAVRSAFREEFAQSKPDMLFIGMARGVDIWVGELAVDMRIPFTACIPCGGQLWRWGRTWTDRYLKLHSKAAKVVRTSTDYHCEPRHYKRRNAFMVDQAEKVIALWDSTPGGTAHCVKYAQATNTLVVNVYGRFRELFNPASP